jgi:hypothetical protein
MDNLDAKSEVFMAMRIHIVVKIGGSKVLQNCGILPYQYMVS